MASAPIQPAPHEPFEDKTRMTNRNKKFRIMYLDESSAIGGAEIYLKMLLEHFAHEYEVAVVHPDDEIHAEHYRIPGICRQPVPLEPVSGAAKMMQYCRIFKQFAPDLLHVNQPAPDRCFHGIVAGRLASVPRIVATCHLPGMQFRRSALGVVAGKGIYDYVVYKTVFGILDKVIVVSGAGVGALKEFYRVSDGKGMCIHNGVDCEKFQKVDAAATGALRNSLGIPENHLVLTSVGRLHAQKDFSLLIRAFADVYRNHRNVHLVIVGEGELRQELEELAAGLGVGSVTHFTGQRKDIPEILAASDIYVNSSLYEGLPFTILEAMAAGLPVIASCIDGNKEVLKDGNGLLFPPGGQEQLAEGVTTLIRNAEYRKSLGATGKGHVKTNYSLARMMHKTRRIYLG